MPARKRDVTIRAIAQEVGLDPSIILDVLKEIPGVKVSREMADRIFKAARKLGYDFKKLKIGKRMQTRKETFDEILEKISENTGWGRSEIIRYLKESRGLVERVHKRVFREEFGGDSR